MVSPEPSSHPQPMTKPTLKAKASLWFTDGFLFLGGAFLALLLLITIYSFINPSPSSSPNFGRAVTPPISNPGRHSDPGPDLMSDPPDRTFYDDPELTYTIGSPVKNWDEKRRQWLMYHPSFGAGAAERILMVTGSQPSACKNHIGDHLLLRFFKNKVDYSRIHGIDLFYNNAFMHPEMKTYWAKIPVIRAAMVAHPEAEWIWWVDSDALFTDMDFKLPLEKYTSYNLVVHGWAHLILDTHSWTGLNAGVFLIRNCEWSMKFLEAWAAMGPQTPDYEKWGETLRATFKDKAFPESDDQTGLAYLIYKENEKWADRIYLESDYYFEGYWAEIVGNLENITEKYTEIEKRRGDEDVARLRRRHAEKVSEQYGAFREKFLKDAGSGYGVGSWRRPFVTHFTGCQPCSGAHNLMYSGTSCWDGMQKALNFADNQVLRKYGFVHASAVDSSIQPLPFNYPVVS
ncbi:PREDICTED: galactomannan galactosyltransferase 1-like [Fragaria vesca subsp. vesca]|uniref:galactomannan galactosyltransferase 1-like n=1 Tax=Fragaria vesca subsp. vesca TaxID=101020 RepID=UPI0002C2E7B4|nr:PREDICTED: galactomannan galactosyltransferase 1-like [Fragaria vesca subsp. vesca]